MLYPQLPAGAFLAAFLVIIPLPGHWRARNVATLAMIAWLFAVDIIYAVNSLIWAGNVNNSAPVWCDISTKIVVGASFALPLTAMCICKHLEMVSSGRTVKLDSADKRRRVIFDSVMCFGVPLIFMALHYIVQGHRFDIIENFGCQATTYESTPAVILIWLPQLLFAVITLIYAAMALRHFIHRRISFSAHLQKADSALTTNRYLRLIAMSIGQMCWGTSFTALNLYNNVSLGLRPWTNWADVHSDFSRVALFATVGIPQSALSKMMLLWWALPASSFIFFLFFGFGEEAKKEYHRIWLGFRHHILRQNIEPAPGYTKSFASSNPRPVHISTLAMVELGHGTDEKNPPLSASTSPFTPTKEDLDTPTLSYYGHSMQSPTTTDWHDSDTTSYRRHSISDTKFSPASISEEYSSRPGSRSSASLPSPRSGSTTPAPVPAYHRPTSPQNGFPVPLHSAHPTVEGGIIVTIHRQAHTDIV